MKKLLVILFLSIFVLFSCENVSPAKPEEKPTCSHEYKRIASTATLHKAGMETVKCIKCGETTQRNCEALKLTDQMWFSYVPQDSQEDVIPQIAIFEEDSYTCLMGANYNQLTLLPHINLPEITLKGESGEDLNIMLWSNFAEGKIYYSMNEEKTEVKAWKSGENPQTSTIEEDEHGYKTIRYDGLSYIAYPVFSEFDIALNLFDSPEGHCMAMKTKICDLEYDYSVVVDCYITRINNSEILDIKPTTPHTIVNGKCTECGYIVK